MARWMLMLPWLAGIQGFTFIPFRLYEGLWRYTGLRDLRNIIAAVLSSTVGFYLPVHWGLGLTGYTRLVFIIDALLLILFERYENGLYGRSFRF